MVVVDFWIVAELLDQNPELQVVQLVHPGCDGVDPVTQNMKTLAWGLPPLFKQCDQLLRERPCRIHLVRTRLQRGSRVRGTAGIPDRCRIRGLGGQGQLFGLQLLESIPLLPANDRGNGDNQDGDEDFHGWLGEALPSPEGGGTFGFNFNRIFLRVLSSVILVAIDSCSRAELDDLTFSRKATNTASLPDS